MFAPKKTRVVRIALTGGPCAGKSSALEHLIAAATAEGFDVLTAPEMATLIFNSSYRLNPMDPDFAEQKYIFQRNVMKLQLQLERSFSDLAGSTGRPSIVVFDRGIYDGKAYLTEEEWRRGVDELNLELTNGRPQGCITDEYLLQRYDGVVHLVTAAEGAEEFYKHGVVFDDSGRQVFRPETPLECCSRGPHRPCPLRNRSWRCCCASWLTAAGVTVGRAIEKDRNLRDAWGQHPNRVIVENGHKGFQQKLQEATEAVLVIARGKHPKVAIHASMRSHQQMKE